MEGRNDCHVNTVGIFFFPFYNIDLTLLRISYVFKLLSANKENILFTFVFDRLSYALSASKIKGRAQVVAMDLRGHGKSATENDIDLSIEVDTAQATSI